jgi:hypothetical protein
MASSYSSDLKLEIMVTGENSGTWGDITNTNLVLLQQSIAGYEAVSIAGGAQTTALAMTDGALSNARNAVIKLTGTITGNQVVTIPDGIEKTYTIENGTVGAFTVEFKTVSGTGPTWSTTDKGIKILYSDGTNIIDINVNLSTIVVPAGTVSLPSISTTGDTNTGIFFPSADTIAFTEGGTEAMRINSNGNIGIGTTNSTLAKVYISHAGDVDDNGLYIESNIGQTVPLVKIIQDGAGSTAPAVYVRNDDADGVVLHLEKGDSGLDAPAFANALFIEDDANTGITIGTPTNGIGSIAFGDSGDNDIGKFQYQHSDNSMLWVVNAAERMRIDSSGRVMIGTTTEGYSSVDDLTIATTGHTGITIRSSAAHEGAIYFSDATSGTGEYAGYMQYIHSNDSLILASNAAERMRIDSSGNVGIGTSSPEGVLDLGSATAGRGIVWGGSAGGSHYGSIWSEHGTGSIVVGAGLKGSTSNSDFIYPYTGTYGYGAIELDSFADDGIKFYTEADGARTAGDVATKNERMRINTSGNVGIGTSSPNNILEVSKSNAGSATSIIIRNQNGISTLGNKSELYLANTNSLTHGAKITADFVGTPSVNHKTDLVFYTTNAGSAFGERMRIDSGGQVGIGTSSPSQVLDVVGSIEVSDGIYIGGTVAANKLDDYEEGTWTPEIADASSGGNVSPGGAAVSGRYRKIGAVVHYNILYTNVNTTGLTSGNLVYIRNLPFLSQSIAGGMEMNSIAGVNSASLTTGCVTLNIGSNRTYGILANQTTSGQVGLTVSQLTSGATDFFIQGTYFTA